MRTRPRYISLIEVEAGMVLGAPTNAVNHGVVRFSLPAEHMLSDDKLHQFASHHAECIFIAKLDTRPDEQVVIDAARTAHRAMEICSGGRLSDPTMAALFDKVRTDRSA